ncbi:hypothetical protein [Falsirhodobacter sp. 1013]|uniref:hypothetical protein n=1 Tax=Falsirhodobacter sp. 1013 TaxID=3417566 RepID=UPI003EBB6D0F
MTANPQPHLTAAQLRMLRDATRIQKRKERRQQHQQDAYRATHDEREDEDQ